MKIWSFQYIFARENFRALLKTSCLCDDAIERWQIRHPNKERYTTLSRIVVSTSLLNLKPKMRVDMDKRLIVSVCENENRSM